MNASYSSACDANRGKEKCSICLVRLAGLAVLVEYAVDTLFAQAGIVVYVLRRKLPVFTEQQLYRQQRYRYSNY